ncbi:MAG TPA: MarR family transcriptional regulator [Jatrophihabitans sp.]|nr:MarR family transcriptional regulator [Jatrophihabitans sp.]
MASSSGIPGRAGPVKPRRRTGLADYDAAVAGYIAAGADESVQRVVTALSRIGKRLDNYYRQQLAELNLQRGDWGVLSELALHSEDGCSTPSRLADVTGVSPSTMTHRLDQLVQRGLVQRAPDPDNRTRTKVRLTRAGRELFRASILDADVAESEVLSALTGTERGQLADLLEKVLTAHPHTRSRNG